MASEGESASSAEFTAPSLSDMLGTPEAAPDPEPDDKEQVQDNASAESSESNESKGEEDSDSQGDAKTGEETDAPPASDSEGDEERKVPLAALLSLRGENKALKAELEELSSKVPTVQDESNTDPTLDKIPSVFDGEQAHTKAIVDHIPEAIFQDRAKRSLKAAEKEFGTERTQEIVDFMANAVKINPELKARIYDADSPIMEAAEIAQELETAQALNDPEKAASMIEKIRAEEREKLISERGESDSDDDVPDSIVGDRAAGGLKAGTPARMKSIEELLR